MKLTEKYKEELAKVDSSSLGKYVDDVDVYEFPGELSEDVAMDCAIVVGDAIEPRESIRWAQSRGYEHFVNKSREDYFSSLLASCLLLKTPDAFAKNPLPFFINNLDLNVKNSEFRHREIRFHSTKTRQKDLNTLATFLAENKKTKNKIQQAHLIADEMMSNALFNAPVDFNGDHIYSKRERTAEVTLPDHEGSNLFIAHDENRLIISCRDPFGSLQRQSFMDRLYDLYWSKVKSGPRSGAGGAGLGCKMMIENSGDFFVLCAKDRYTLFACSIPLGMGRRAFGEYPRNIHFVFR